MVAPTKDGTEMTKQCCVCKRLQAGTDWHETFPGPAPRPEQITHGYCPPCFEDTKRQLKRWIADRRAAAVA